MEELSEVKKILRGMLMSSQKGLTVSQLLKDYASEEGEPIPFKQFGFNTVFEFLQSMPDVMRFQSSAPPCGGSIIFPAYSEKTQHIAELVAGQKEKQIKRSKSVPRHRYYDQSNHYSRNSYSSNYTSNPRPPRFSSSRDNRFYDNLRSHISSSSTSTRRPSDYNNESHTIPRRTSYNTEREHNSSSYHVQSSSHTQQDKENLDRVRPRSPRSRSSPNYLECEEEHSKQEYERDTHNMHSTTKKPKSDDRNSSTEKESSHLPRTLQSATSDLCNTRSSLDISNQPQTSKPSIPTQSSTGNSNMPSLLKKLMETNFQSPATPPSTPSAQVQDNALASILGIGQTHGAQAAEQSYSRPSHDNSRAINFDSNSMRSFQPSVPLPVIPKLCNIYTGLYNTSLDIQSTLQHMSMINNNKSSVNYGQSPGQNSPYYRPYPYSQQSQLSISSNCTQHTPTSPGFNNSSQNMSIEDANDATHSTNQSHDSHGADGALDLSHVLQTRLLKSKGRTPPPPGFESLPTIHDQMSHSDAMDLSFDIPIPGNATTEAPSPIPRPSSVLLSSSANYGPSTSSLANYSATMNSSTNYEARGSSRSPDDREQTYGNSSASVETNYECSDFKKFKRPRTPGRSKTSTPTSSITARARSNCSTPSSIYVSGSTSSVDRLDRELNLVGKRMHENLKELMKENTEDGIRCSSLPSLYEAKYKVPLNFREYGTQSVIQFVEKLPSIFKVFDPPSAEDWFLFDPDQEIPAKYLQEPLIPEGIEQAIDKILVRCTNGFFLDQFPDKYEQFYRVPFNLKDYPTFRWTDAVVHCTVVKKIARVNAVGHRWFFRPLNKSSSNDLDNLVPAVVPNSVMNRDQLAHYREMYILRIDQMTKITLDGIGLCDEVPIILQDGLTPHNLSAILSENKSMLDEMMDDLNQVYNAMRENDLEMEYEHLKKGNICVARYGTSESGMDGDWHRCKIIKVIDNSKAKLLFLDFGTIGYARVDRLKYMTPDYAALPVQCLYVTLYKVMPPEYDKTGVPLWDKKGLDKLLIKYENVKVMATVFGYDDEPEPRVTAWLTAREAKGAMVELNKEFCEWGFGVLHTEKTPFFTENGDSKKTEESASLATSGQQSTPAEPARKKKRNKKPRPLGFMLPQLIAHAREIGCALDNNTITTEDVSDPRRGTTSDRERSVLGRKCPSVSEDSDDEAQEEIPIPGDNVLQDLLEAVAAAEPLPDSDEVDEDNNLSRISEKPAMKKKIFSESETDQSDGERTQMGSEAVSPVPRKQFPPGLSSLLDIRNEPGPRDLPSAALVSSNPGVGTATSKAPDTCLNTSRSSEQTSALYKAILSSVKVVEPARAPNLPPDVLSALQSEQELPPPSGAAVMDCFSQQRAPPVASVAPLQQNIPLHPVYDSAQQQPVYNLTGQLNQYSVNSTSPAQQTSRSVNSALQQQHSNTAQEQSNVYNSTLQQQSNPQSTYSNAQQQATQQSYSSAPPQSNPQSTYSNAQQQGTQQSYTSAPPQSNPQSIHNNAQQQATQQSSYTSVDAPAVNSSVHTVPNVPNASTVAHVPNASTVPNVPEGARLMQVTYQYIIRDGDRVTETYTGDMATSSNAGNENRSAPSRHQILNHRSSLDYHTDSSSDIDNTKYDRPKGSDSETSNTPQQWNNLFSVPPPTQTTPPANRPGTRSSSLADLNAVPGGLESLLNHIVQDVTKASRNAPNRNNINTPEAYAQNDLSASNASDMSQLTQSASQLSLASDNSSTNVNSYMTGTQKGNMSWAPYGQAGPNYAQTAYPYKMSGNSKMVPPNMPPNSNMMQWNRNMGASNVPLNSNMEMPNMNSMPPNLNMGLSSMPPNMVPSSMPPNMIPSSLQPNMVPSSMPPNMVPTIMPPNSNMFQPNSNMGLYSNWAYGYNSMTPTQHPVIRPSPYGNVQFVPSNVPAYGYNMPFQQNYQVRNQTPPWLNQQYGVRTGNGTSTNSLLGQPVYKQCQQNVLVDATNNSRQAMDAPNKVTSEKKDNYYNAKVNSLRQQDLENLSEPLTKHGSCSIKWNNLDKSSIDSKRNGNYNVNSKPLSNHTGGRNIEVLRTNNVESYNTQDTVSSLPDSCDLSQTSAAPYRPPHHHLHATASGFNLECNEHKDFPQPLSTEEFDSSSPKVENHHKHTEESETSHELRDDKRLNAPSCFNVEALKAGEKCHSVLWTKNTMEDSYTGGQMDSRTRDYSCVNSSSISSHQQSIVANQESIENNSQSTILNQQSILPNQSIVNNQHSIATAELPANSASTGYPSGNQTHNPSSTCQDDVSSNHSGALGSTKSDDHYVVKSKAKNFINLRLAALETSWTPNCDDFVALRFIEYNKKLMNVLVLSGPRYYLIVEQFVYHVLETASVNVLIKTLGSNFKDSILVRHTREANPVLFEKLSILGKLPKDLDKSFYLMDIKCVTGDYFQPFRKDLTTLKTALAPYLH